MSQDGHDKKGASDHGALTSPQLNLREQIRNRWPMGLTALTFIVLSWLGIYLLWNGIVFAFLR